MHQLSNAQSLISKNQRYSIMQKRSKLTSSKDITPNMTKKSHNQRDSKSLFSERSSLAQFLQSKAIPRSATPRNEQESSINSKQDAKVKISRAILEDKSSLLMPQNEYSNHQSNMITFKAGSLKGDQSRRTDQKENSILESPNRKLSGQNEFQTQINVK